MVLFFIKGFQTTVRGPNPDGEAISTTERRHFVNNETNIFTKICWFGGMQHIKKQ